MRHLNLRDVRAHPTQVATPSRPYHTVLRPTSESGEPVCTVVRSEGDPIVLLFDETGCRTPALDVTLRTGRSNHWTNPPLGTRL